MDDKDLNLLKNIPYLMEKIEELENRIKQLEQAAQPKSYPTQTPNYLGEI
ncbi:hypothetical protein ACOW6G_001799 [Campylobacter coli]|nr:hypothetical protein [Campylobacter coli]EKB0724616.1 hypothetical protein [Campylobacter coli]EKT7747099.1 hypothetical protein [Campylobacter coli]HED6203969.1 hypothetical protein [Campylobacter coli]HEF2269013.1 hypothetical protein [Campylobacter coli]